MGDFVSFSEYRIFTREQIMIFSLAYSVKLTLKKQIIQYYFQESKFETCWLSKKKVEKNAPKMVFWSNLVGSCVVIGTCACHYGWVTENNPKPTLLFPLVTVWHSLRMPQQWGQIILKFKSGKFPCPKVFTRKSSDAVFLVCTADTFQKW